MEVESAAKIGRPGAEKQVGKESIPGHLGYCRRRTRSMHLSGGHLWARTSENAQKAKFAEFIFYEVG
jgi:hypothetical protein